MKIDKKPLVVFIVCISLYFLIKNILKGNSAPTWMYVFSYIPIIISIGYDLKIVFKNYKLKQK